MSNGNQGDSNCSLRTGTLTFGLLCGLAGAAMAFMFLFLGFWKTIFVAALFAVGYFLGAVSHKSARFKQVINKLFPPKGQQIIQPAPTKDDLRAFHYRYEDDGSGGEAHEETKE